MRLRRAVPVALTILLCTTAAATANDSGDRRGGREDFVPVHRLAGTTGGELLGQWWKRVLEIPAATNPIELDNTPLCMELGRHGGVLAAASSLPVTTCTMRAGMDLFIPVQLAECSSNEPDLAEPDFHAIGERAQRECAIGWVFPPQEQVVRAINLSLDGGPAVDIHRKAFEEVSPQFRAVFPQGPIFDATPGTTTFVGAGYGVTTRHELRPGRHVVDAEIVLAEGDPIVFSIVIDVVRRGHGRD